MNLTLFKEEVKKIEKAVGERFGKSIKDVVPPRIFLITDAAKTESPIYMCCLILWEAPPGFI